MNSGALISDVRSLWRPWLALAFFSIASARGEEGGSHLLNLSLEELGSVKVDTVFAASKFSEKVTDAPSSVTIVTRDEIRRFGYRTLGEIVRSVRSFDVTYDREYSYTSARGYNRLSDYGARTLLLVDGHRMNDPLYAAASVGTEALLDVDLIERVEFIRGPGSAIYGSNALLAVINVVTRSGADVDGVETSGSIGTFDAHTARFTLGKKFQNGFEFFLSATTFESEGNARLFYKEYDAPETNRGLAVHRDGDRFWSVFGKMSYGDFTLEGGYVTREKEVPTGSFDAVFNRPNQDTDSRGYLELRYAHETAEGWKYAARAYYDDYDYKNIGPYPNADGIGVTNNDSSRQHWWGAEASVGKEFHFLNGFRFTMGAELYRSMQLRTRNYDEVAPLVFSDGNIEQQVAGIYLDTHTQLTKQLGLAAGTRYDYYDTFGDTLNPRFGLIWKPWERTTLKLLYGQAFRAPDAQENKFGLQPETVRTYEFVAEQYFGGHWRASASLFQNTISDLIDFADESPTLTNFGEARVRGGEIEFEGKWDRGWLVRASYSRQQACESDTGARLINSPEDMAKVQVGIPLHGDKLTANLEGLFVGDRLTLLREKTGPTWLLNATLYSRELLPNLELSASIYNLLDRKDRVPGGVRHLQDALEQDGRTFRLKLTHRF